MDEQALREMAEEHLRALAGPTATLREDQWSAIRALVLERRRALVVQRTGWGKSAVYFVATALLRDLGEGPTVIVSPLLALMRNQVEAASAAGVQAATINSANPDEWASIEEEVAVGDVDVLLVSPERLNNPDFRENVLPELTRNTGLVVVDEAHCISDWGHDFRPDYRRLRTLLTELPEGVPVLATTATANDRVVRDVSDQLGVTEDSNAPSTPLVLRGSLDRESLRLGVVPLHSTRERLGWLADHLEGLPGSGIIYTLTVATAEEVAEFLTERGFAVSSYSGRTEANERAAAESALLNNEVKALVATSALGMGFDKPDLGFVIHLGAPASPIAYYQQIGRAGRGVEHAEVVLLPGEEDQRIWDYFTSLTFPDEATVRAVLHTLDNADKPLSTAALEPHVELSRSRLEMVLKVLDVDGAVKRVKGGWTATGQPWSYEGERYERIARQRRAEQQSMLDYQRTAKCRMEFLRSELDDPHAEPCGRCDNCTGVAYSTEVDSVTSESARQRLERAGVTLSPRKMWPNGMRAVDIPVSGKIAPSEQHEPGRALGRFSDIGWGGKLRELLGPEASDGEVPEELVQACVRVLADWDWARRPAGVVAMGSSARPMLVASLAERIAAIGRLPLLGHVAHDPARRTQRSHNSARRLAGLWSRFGLPDELSLTELGGPVLLVDDYTDTGWTLAVVARMLRQAGASGVLPLTLAST
ncbi:ATP-dependent DNA helicase RecQ [Actinopolyspora erythraea]|uniref:ATP-dependent DNA helicase RecQ n=1 Tax=Actinopolyspora erythraea TaxID=414996 RepID=A0ABR4WZU6_9ACTN|nr:RecQ family ATP-dependent DNA helicase [Actinopolyspora erythraea]KGI79911.1 ATP-dependent DNA helicase RecQ [Actinopolyspora erythraea]